MSTTNHAPTLHDIDPRGIRQKQVRVIEDPNGGTTLVQFECGHISEMVNHFTYKVGDTRFCLKCGKEAKERNSHAALVTERYELCETAQAAANRADDNERKVAALVAALEQITKLDIAFFDDFSMLAARMKDLARAALKSAQEKPHD